MSPGSNFALDRPSTYLDYLPGIYQQDAEKGAFVGRYLKIFEKLLSGIDDESLSHVSIKGMEQVVARLHEFFDPESAPRDFLDWLAGWMALVLRETGKSQEAPLDQPDLAVDRTGERRRASKNTSRFMLNVSVDIRGRHGVSGRRVDDRCDTYVGGGLPTSSS